MSQYVTYILLETRIVWIGPSSKRTFHVLRLVVHPRHRTMKHQREKTAEVEPTAARSIPDTTANQPRNEHHKLYFGAGRVSTFSCPACHFIKKIVLTFLSTKCVTAQIEVISCHDVAICHIHIVRETYCLDRAKLKKNISCFETCGSPTPQDNETPEGEDGGNGTNGGEE